jgi:K+:H+ antiporter
MKPWSALNGLLLLLAGAFLLGALAERLRQSAILGYLLAGMLLGPHGLGLVGQTANSPPSWRA